MTESQIMNISKNNISGKCNEKCSYYYKYQTSTNCSVTISQYSITLSYDTQSQPPVKFNNTDYNVLSINLYFNSLHKFNDNRQSGEIVIMHNSLTNNNKLYVCLPISTKFGAPNALINNLFNEIINNKPNDGVFQIKPTEDYNINSIVNYSPYYYYLDNTAKINFIVYGINNAIYITDQLLSGMNNLVMNSNENDCYMSVSKLFFNETGPTKYLDDEIFIDCQPVNSSDNTQEILFENNMNSNNYNVNIGNEPTFNIILIVILGVFLLVVIGFVYLNDSIISLSLFSSSSSSLLSSSSVKTKNNNFINQFIEEIEKLWKEYK